MILGIGTDVVEIARIEQKVLHRAAFCQAVFSANETAYCEKIKNRFESYAARFAAKEAFLKALGTGLLIACELNEIEVENNPSGKPDIHLSPLLHEKVKEIFAVPNFKIHLSLSHTSQVAIAFVIIEAE
ncbi:MAG: holo-ACP synthase [Bacteroidota bacterium]